ncbi:MAG: sulfatase-like hydrolase/transferase [bacterium]
MKNLLLVVVDCARTEKTVAHRPLATPFTRRSARLPFLDSLRRRGTTWTGYTAVSSTTTPNFATMFTGLLPREHGIVEHSRCALSDVTTLAEILRRRGFTTRAEVTGPLLAECGLNRGFDSYRWRDRSEYLDAGFAAELSRVLHDLPEPWFLCVHLWEAHMPYRVPAALAGARFGLGVYDRALSAADAGLAGALEDLDLSRTALVWCGDHGERLEADYERNRTLGGDEARVLDLWRRFVAEHGADPFDFDAWFDEAAAHLGPAAARIYAHNVLGHGFHLTEDLVRTPLVVVDADRCAAGVTREELRSQLDLFPTLLDLAGLPAGEHEIAERSFLRARAPSAVYVEANGSGGKQQAARCYLRGVRTDRLKYWRLEADGVEKRVLFDLAEDPRETVDATARLPEEAARLEERLDLWMRRGAAGARATLTPAEEERLASTMKALGYL